MTPADEQYDINHINKLGHEGVEIKKLEDIKDLRGIILPGGENTTIGKLLRERNMFATAFHPELTDNLEVHRYFMNMCK